VSTRTFRAMNTEWWLGTADDRDLAPLEALVHTAEARYSRFQADSLLSQLNRDRSAHDAEFARLVRDALALGAATAGAFDIRIGAAVRAAGYDRSFETITAVLRSPALSFAPPVDALTIEVEGDDVRLHGTGSIDLGGIAKGWTVDRVAEALEADGCHDYLVDGGGDIRVAGHDSDGALWTIGGGEGLTASVPAGAVCTSSTRRRRWRTATEDAHHIIDPATAAPARHDVIEAVVIAPLAATADALATTLIAQPEHGLAALAAFEADALLLRNGAWEMTEGMRRWLQ
jgi:thiamine biosynthesis lipoprotein